MRLIKHDCCGTGWPRSRRQISKVYRADTLVVDYAPDYTEMLERVGQALFDDLREIDLKVGLAETHPDDNFCKKTGIVLADSRSKIHTGVIVGITYTVEHFVVAIDIMSLRIHITYAKNKRPFISKQTPIYQSC